MKTLVIINRPLTDQEVSKINKPFKIITPQEDFNELEKIAYDGNYTKVVIVDQPTWYVLRASWIFTNCEFNEMSARLSDEITDEDCVTHPRVTVFGPDGMLL